MIDRTQISSGPGAAADAAQRLLRGQVVAVPTETVYGLAADATNTDGVAAIFAVKGRPATNPLITHVLSMADARLITGAWPKSAEILAAAFWPGPLTMVLPSAGKVAPAVSAGLSTIGVRVPAHPVMREILAQAKIPLAAPSANRSGHISPTTAQHVFADLDGRIGLIVDGGPSAIGIESTVVGFRDEQPIIYRPGIITTEDIDQALRRAGINNLPATIFSATDGAAMPSPGLLSRHYAPGRPTYLFFRAAINRFPPQWMQVPEGKRRGVICFGTPTDMPFEADIITLPEDLYHAAGRLYSAMHQLDRPMIDMILIELPGSDQLPALVVNAHAEPKDCHLAALSGMARVLADRLGRAASPWPRVPS